MARTTFRPHLAAPVRTPRDDLNRWQQSTCDQRAVVKNGRFVKEDEFMRRLILAALLATSLASSVGCFLPAYSADPAQRTRQLIFQSEEMRYLLEEWERFWFLDQPSHLTPRRMHGGII